MERALSSSTPSGSGIDVPLAEAAVRGLARASLVVPEGQRAVLMSKGVQHLLAVMRADNNALEAVIANR
jgi:hypothetical protein